MDRLSARFIRINAVSMMHTMVRQNRLFMVLAFLLATALACQGAIAYPSVKMTGNSLRPLHHADHPVIQTNNSLKIANRLKEEIDPLHSPSGGADDTPAWIHVQRELIEDQGIVTQFAAQTVIHGGECWRMDNAQPRAPPAITI